MNLRESLEESVFLNGKHQKELNQLKKEMQKKNTEVCQQKSQILYMKN